MYYTYSYTSYVCSKGVTFPCIHAVWSNWAPPQERTKLASIAYAGGFFGTVVAFPASGYLANAFGWPSAFYIPGKPAAAAFHIYM